MNYPHSIVALIFLLCLPACADPNPPQEPDSYYTTPDADPSPDTDATPDTDVDPDPPTQPEPWSCAPDLSLDGDTYADLEGLTDDALRTELFFTVESHTDRGYTTARDIIFNQLDVHDLMIECVYTGRLVQGDTTRTPDGFNTEHSWPRSRGADFQPALSDINHLFPVDADANNERGNVEFGNVNCSPNNCNWHQGGSFLGASADDNRNPVFEVRPERRGDIARAIFYFSLRYSNDISAQEESVLRQWNCQDPPDDLERTRNDNIEFIQNRRNPFIDRPDFIERIDNFRGY